MDNGFFKYSLSSAPKNYFSNPEFGTPMDMGSITPKFKGGSQMADAFKSGGNDKFRLAGTLGSLLQGGGGFQPYDADKEAMRDLMRRPFGGGSIPGSTQRLAGGLTMTLPRAFEPIITPGGGGYQGPPTGQRIAGAAGGALSGAATGAAFGPVGALVGGGIGLLGGLL